VRAAALVLAGCGRVAFDPLGDAHGDALSMSDGVPDAPSLPGLVAYWPFETASTGAIPDIIGGHDAACIGTACPDSIVGHHGQAYIFDGVDDCVTVPDPGVFQVPRFTLSLWAHQTMTRIGSQISKFLGPAGGTNNSWQLETGDGTVSSPVDGISFTTNPNLYLWSAPGTVKVGQWQHLAATFDGTNLVLYVDGAVAATATSGAINYDSGAVWIGCDDNSGGPAYDEAYSGALDEVQIYDRALSAAEIQLLASS
jgi:hypothetical protein